MGDSGNRDDLAFDTQGPRASARQNGVMVVVPLLERVHKSTDISRLVAACWLGVHVRRQETGYGHHNEGYGRATEEHGAASQGVTAARTQGSA